ncbi:MAG TPA: hypothetical protein VKG22_05880 [Stellaceae bacterium]|nr:hypothetical protein [Stellaceae bacterium]
MVSGTSNPRAGVRDQADPGEDLIRLRLDHDLVGAVDPLDPRRTISERRIRRPDTKSKRACRR